MLEEFLHHLEIKGLSHKTVKSYSVSWKRFETWMQSTSPDHPIEVAYATQRDIADFKRHLLVAGGRGGKPAWPATNQLTFVHLNAIFRFFAEQGYILTIRSDRSKSQQELAVLQSGLPAMSRMRCCGKFGT
ncbi:site-specific integrase [Paenibacillus sonchi]|uniref:site-specific integrase n=1 Tax=Paenibacillus sonchi TaxID=373687 RepID=UPI000585014E|nr:site-specific integrase [Paenibacillus sonchi]